MLMLSDAVAKTVAIIALVFIFVFGVLWILTNAFIPKLLVLIAIAVDFYALRELRLNAEANGKN